MHARDLWQVRSIKEGRCGAIVTNRDNRTGRSSVTAANKQSKKVAGTAMLQAAKDDLKVREGQMRAVAWLSGLSCGNGWCPSE